MATAKAESGVDLEWVIGGIWRAVQEAKHSGDVESARLSETYRKDKGLSGLNVPAFEVADLSLELRFAVVDVAGKRVGTETVPSLEVQISADALNKLDPNRLQLMRLRLTPMPLRVVETESGG